MHRLVVSQPGKGQPGWGGQAMSRGSPTPPTGQAPGKEELLFAPCFCLPGRLGGDGASTRRLAARSMLSPHLEVLDIRHVDTGRAMHGPNPAPVSTGEEINKPGREWLLPTDPLAHELAAGFKDAPSLELAVGILKPKSTSVMGSSPDGSNSAGG